MADRFPDYDVLAKRDTLSWNDRTRDVIDQRLALGDREGLDEALRRTLVALVDRVAPQPEGRAPVNAWALVLEKVAGDQGDGYRPAGMPRTRDAWTRGLLAIDAEAWARAGRPFAELAPDDMDAVLAAVERGEASDPAWGDLDPAQFWRWRLLPDVVAAYWAHPSAWSAMGFGGPASPRGYVRLEANRRDPWEAAEQADGAAVPARRRDARAG